jgi:uncharacterized protein (DUF1015 family)
MIEMKVWEIIAQREPHTNVDPVDVGALIRFALSPPSSLSITRKDKRNVNFVEITNCTCNRFVGLNC